MIFPNKNAILMCSGCPGVPGRLKAKTGRTVKNSSQPELTEADKDLQSPAFGTCLAIPTAPKKCSPQLGKWVNLKSDVKIKGKSALLFPNMIPCMAGPGVITMTFAGQVLNQAGSTSGEEQTYPCDWEGCTEKHVMPSKLRFPNQEMGVVTKQKDGGNDSKKPADFTGPWFHPSCYERIYGFNLKNSPEQKNWFTRKNGIRDFSTKDDYATQRHHVIPVKAVLRHLTKIKTNLKLLGWDVNNSELNGIQLPGYTRDIFWHDIPLHNAAHSNYNKAVKKLLRKLESDCGDLCAKEEYYQLWEKITETVKVLKENIVNWKKGYLLNSKSITRRISSFNRANISLSNPNKTYNRKFD